MNWQNGDPLYEGDYLTTVATTTGERKVVHNHYDPCKGWRDVEGEVLAYIPIGEIEPYEHPSENKELDHASYIDLGLSVKWATCNVGANLPEEYGEHYSYDEAMNLGLRLPSLGEIKELIDKCDWMWTQFNGVNGYNITGPNGNSIFLPAAGFRYDTSLYGAGSRGGCWSATPFSGCYGACYLYFGSDDYYWYDGNRGFGFTVRPVSEE